MIRVSQHRTGRVAPSFSVEMQTQHKIRMQFEIHQRSAASNLAVPIEQDFALPTDGLLFRLSYLDLVAFNFMSTPPRYPHPSHVASIIQTTLFDTSTNIFFFIV